MKYVLFFIFATIFSVALILAQRNAPYHFNQKTGEGIFLKNYGDSIVVYSIRSMWSLQNRPKVEKWKGKWSASKKLFHTDNCTILVEHDSIVFCFENSSPSIFTR